MSRFPRTASLAALVAVMASPVLADGFGLGRQATPAEVAAWDIDVRPDGQGLPAGSGDVLTGEELFVEQCAACHGDFGEGVDRWPVLAGGQDTLVMDRPVKTIGSYWPYLSTVYDYVNRAMPFGYAQSLTPDDVYAITAYLLYVNDVVEDEEFVLSNENFTQVRLPNEQAFTQDVRPDTPTLADAAPCMSDCKPAVEITMRAMILDVTPDSEDGAQSGLSVE
ncbi:MAG: cytochrome c [Pseudomonadota bacterium]